MFGRPGTHVNLLLFTIQVLSISLFFCSRSLAVPAPAFVGTIVQPDGTEFKARLKGDERLHWYETEDGYTIVKDKDAGWWHYALSAGGYAIKSSEAKVGVADPSLHGIRKLSPAFNTMIREQSVGSGPYGSRGTKSLTYPADRAILVVLVEFNNISGAYAPQSFDSLLFSASGKSALTYYKEVSYGKLNIVPASESFGSNNGVVGWLKLNQGHPDCISTPNPLACNDKLFSDAVLAADRYVDFSSYDRDGDGKITPEELAIVIVAAGYDKSVELIYGYQSPGLWASSTFSSTTTPPVLVDGRSINRYLLVGERHGSHQATLGVFVHELGHLLFELPDLYHPYEWTAGISAFDVMAAGGWCKSVSDEYYGQTPVHLSAWSKEYAGFITPAIMTGGKTVAVSEASKGYDAIIKLPTQNSKEYFLIENRYFSGYDIGFEGCLDGASSTRGGLAVWHIDETVFDDGCLKRNVCNNSGNHKLIELKEADGIENLDIPFTVAAVDKPDATELFYNGNNIVFSDTSTPDNRFYSGISNGTSVSNISPPGPVMTLDIRAFSGKPSVPSNQVIDHSFEEGGVNWSEYGGGGLKIISQEPKGAFNGSWFAWMGGYDDASEYVFQDLTIPSGSVYAYLQFWYSISTKETASEAYDRISVEIRNPSDDSILKKIAGLSNLDKTLTWRISEQYDLSSFVGRSIRLLFSIKTDESQSTTFFLDSVSIRTIAPSGNEMAAPASASSFTYQGSGPPLISPDPSAARPFSYGDIESGKVNLSAGFPHFNRPVDIYLALYAPHLDSNIWLIKSDNSLQPLSSGLAKWRDNTIGPINVSLYGDIPLKSLPSGAYYLYALVAPAGSLSNYYFLWNTAFAAP